MGEQPGPQHLHPAGGRTPSQPGRRLDFRRYQADEARGIRASGAGGDVTGQLPGVAQPWRDSGKRALDEGGARFGPALWR